MEVCCWAFVVRQQSQFNWLLLSYCPNCCWCNLLLAILAIFPCRNFNLALKTLQRMVTCSSETQTNTCVSRHSLAGAVCRYTNTLSYLQTLISLCDFGVSIQNKRRCSVECNTNYGAAAVSNIHRHSVEYRLKSVKASHQLTVGSYKLETQRHFLGKSGHKAQQAPPDLGRTYLCSYLTFVPLKSIYVNATHIIQCRHMF